MSVLAILLFDVSLLLTAWAMLIQFANHKYGWWDKIASISYLIAGIFFLQQKMNTELIIEVNPLFFMLVFVSINIYAISTIIPHYEITKRANLRMAERLGGAELLSWSMLKEQRQGTIEHYLATDANKKFISKGKFVFESIVIGKTDWYFNDFYKHYQIIDGTLQLIFKTGEIETISRGQTSTIKPYEAHKITPIKGKVKLIVTCVKDE